MLAVIGSALLAVQTVEMTIKACLTYVLPKDGVLSLEAIEHQRHQERRKTLGYFLAELRKRVDVNASFDTELDDFLEKRNLLAHRLREVPGVDLNTERGCGAAIFFAAELVKLSKRVNSVLSGFLRAWQKQVGLPDGPGYEDLIPELDHHAELVDYVFSEKKKEAPQQP
jgi:hypothetical protein